DACHSGATTSSSKSIVDDLVRDLVTEDFGIAVISSSQGSEYSLESPLTGHGFFTLALIEALKGKADYNADQYVYLHEIVYYTMIRVRELSRGEQNPSSGRPANLRSFPLGKVK